MKNIYILVSNFAKQAGFMELKYDYAFFSIH